MTEPFDIKTLSDAELSDLRRDVMLEIERRELMRSAESQIENLTNQYQSAAGIEDGMPYVQPTGAHNAVLPMGKRTFNGKLYQNTSGIALAHSPAEYPAGWTEIGDANGEPPAPEAPAWIPDVLYAVDSMVEEDGVIYRCAIPHTSQSDWRPSVTPALWVRIS